MGSAQSFCRLDPAGGPNLAPGQVWQGPSGHLKGSREEPSPDPPVWREGMWPYPVVGRGHG